MRFFGDYMRKVFLLIATAVAAALTTFPSQGCDLKTRLGISRIIEVNTSGGAQYGGLQYDRLVDLKPGEVVLTFDDGPHPENTISVLRTLEDHCLKATFFVVGKMVSTYPSILKQVADAGHTIAAHSHSHPNMRNISLTQARYEIERSFAEAIHATGKPVAPFFRFPGLAHSKSVNDYLASRNIATMSVDVVSNDTNYKNVKSILRNTMEQLEKKNGGILLLHDLKSTTAEALPLLLDEMKKKGYKIVHIVPKMMMVKADFVIPASGRAKSRIAARKARKLKNQRPTILAAHNSNIKNISKPLKSCFLLLLGCVR